MLLSDNSQALDIMYEREGGVIRQKYFFLHLRVGEGHLKAGTFSNLILKFEVESSSHFVQPERNY